MRANEFIKKFGWEKSKMAVKKLLPMEDGMPVFDYNSEDLKRLVESHNLVGRFGGLHMAKADVMDLDGWEKTSPYWMKIQQAIADVESCQ